MSGSFAPEDGWAYAGMQILTGLAPGPFRSEERKFHGARRPGSERAGSELARVLLADSILGANWPGSEKVVNRNEPYMPLTPSQQGVASLWLVLISRLAEGRRLSWPEWLGEILRRFARTKKITTPVFLVAAGN